ncbi:hypothetical protein E4U21_002122 [Claviceps maximensis]|nr:hypothetical protein E4U21_002122 [Claviceps maximensis]
MPPGFTMSQISPHPTLNAATLTRDFGTDLPPSQRASFIKKYPHGLPRAYKMVSPHDEGVPLSYLEEYLPIGFYTNPPPNAAAKFSTAHGERPFRNMEHILPRRRIHLWDKDQLQTACNSTRKTYWADMKSMTKPSCWNDLWTYYDAHDLYHYGALNLWNLVNQLFDENVLIYDGMERECANHIGQWADEWIGMEHNQRKLREWDEERKSSIVFILSDQDRDSMGDIPDDMFPLVASALKARRHLLLTGVESFRKNREGASDVMEACKNRNFQNWLAGEQVFGSNALPSPPLVETHHCSPASKNAPPPCFEQGGRHYYLPGVMGRSGYRSTSLSSAVEELQKSSAAAGATTQRAVGDVGVKNSQVIAKGTNRLPSDDARKEQMQPLQGKIASKELLESSTSDGNAPAIGNSQQPVVYKTKEEGGEEEKRTPSQPKEPQISAYTDENNVPGVVTGGHTSPSPMPRKNRVVSKREFSEEMASSPTPLGRQDEAHHAQHVKRASLSGETDSSKRVSNYSPIPSNNRPATASGQPGGQPALTPPHYAQSSMVNKGDESLIERHMEQRPVQAPVTAPAASVPFQAPRNPNPLASHPLNVSGQVVNNHGGNDQPARPAFLSSQCESYGHHPRNGVEARSTSDEARVHKEVGHSAQSQSRLLEPSACSNDIHQPQLLPQKPPAVIPNLVLTATSAVQPETTLVSADPNFSSTKNTTLPSPARGRTGTAPRGGYKNNNSNNRGRREFHSQKNLSNGYNQSSSLQNKQQPFFGGPKAADGLGSERHWRRDGTPTHYNHGRYNPHCNNNRTSALEYHDCGCGDCSGRNRSVWVRVKGNPDSDIKDLQTRLKFGLGAIYGEVEDVFPVCHKSGYAFIVRFQNEDSVAHAIGFTNITLPDKNLCIVLGPTHRSKWISKGNFGPELGKKQKFEQRQQQQQQQQQHHNHHGHHHHQHQNPPHLHQHQNLQQQQQQQQFSYATQPHFTQGMYPSGPGYAPMPYGSIEPQQMRMHGPYTATTGPPHGNFQYPQRGGTTMPPYNRGGDINYCSNFGPHYMGGQQQQPSVWQPVQDQHGFHHGPGQAAAVAQSEQRAAFRTTSTDMAECKSQSKPPSDEELEKKDPTVRHDQQKQQQQQQQQQRQKKSPVTAQREANVPLPSATPTKLVDAESRNLEDAASANATISPTHKEEQSGASCRRQHDSTCATLGSFTTEITDGAVEDKEPATNTTTAQSSETLAVADVTAMDTSLRAAASMLTEQDGKDKEQARDTTKLSMPANKVPKTPVKRNSPGILSKCADTAAHDPSSDSHPEESSRIQPAQRDAEIKSPGSCSSKTMSISSTPRTSTPHQNRTKGHSQSSPSPTKSGTRNAKKQNGKSQQQHKKEDDGCHILNAAVQGFEFPGHGRGTVRLPKQGGKPSILSDRKSSRGKGMNAKKGHEKQNSQPVPGSLDEKTWPSLPSSEGGSSPQKKKK